MSHFKQAITMLQSLRPVVRLTKKFVVYPISQVLNWIPITWLGLFVVCLTLFFMRYIGKEKNDRIILIGGVTLLGISAACAICVLLTAIWLRFRPERQTTTAHNAEVAIPYRTGFRLGICGWNPLIRVELAWDQPFDVTSRWVSGRGGLQEEILPESRGMAQFIPRRMIVTDVLGLSRCVIRRQSKATILIKPAFGNAAKISISQCSFLSEQLPDPDGKPEGDLIETRRYSPGDPLKLVMWKVYARTGQLLIRSAERTATITQKGFAYLVAGAGDEPTARTARCMLETNAFGDRLLFGADGSSEYARTNDDALNQVIRSAQARDRAGKGLGDFLARGTAEGLQSGVLFVPPRPGIWLKEITKALAGYQGKIQAIIGTDHGEQTPAAETGLVYRLLFRNGNSGNCDENVAAIREQLESCGVAVTVIARD